ncbi:MAG: FecR domain-containing protein [Pseudomonadales bacterium]
MTWLGSTSVRAADWQYTLRPGDTIWSICTEYTSYPQCWRELTTYNNIDDARSISVGHRIRVPASWLKLAPVAASVLFVNGEVFLGDSNAGQALQHAQQLEIGARVVTQRGSATLRFVDGSLLTMTEFSEIVLDAVSAFRQTRSTEISVSVPRGEVDVRVPLREPRTRFEVHTPSAVAAVRGTRFRVNSDGDAALTRSEVLEGQVGLSAAGDSQLLAGGFGSLARRGEAPIDPVQLLDAPPWNLSCNDPGYAEWFVPPGAQSYKLVLLEDDLQTDRVLQSVSVIDTNYTFRNLETKCYQLRVNAVDPQGFNGFESQRQFCYDLQLAAPALEDLRWRSGSFSAQWADVQYAENYLVEIARDSQFNDMVASYPADVSQLQTGLQALPDEVFVRVRATARDGQVLGGYSDTLAVEHSQPRHWLVGVAAALLALVAL